MPGPSTRFRPPVPRPPDQALPYVTALWKLIDNPIEAWPRAVFEAPHHVRKDGSRAFVYVTEPEALRAILLDEADAFPKDWMFERVVKPALGEGLLTAQGEHWRWQRRAAAPAFRHDLILGMTPVMTRAAETALERWRAAGEGVSFDIAHEMTQVTFDVILETMLSGGEGIDVAETTRQIANYLESLGRVTPADIFGWPDWARQALAPKGQKSVRYMKSMMDQMVARRRTQPPRDDLVDLLMQAKDPETGQVMGDSLVRDNLLTFLGAGHETTALALTWSLYLLASDPQSEARVLAEIAAVAGEDSITADHLEHLVFTRQVVQEAMRLFPSLPIMTRMCARTVQAGSLTIAAGSYIFIPLYALHRHRALWKDPDVFDPDRFAPGSPEANRRFAYMPFGAGPRICIGATFAMNEAVAVLATLIRGARFGHDSRRFIRPLVRISMRPEGGMPMTVRRR